MLNDNTTTNMNTHQLQAAEHVGGPAVVFAGAGSGKTRIITARIAKLIELGNSPWEILALTFTNKAAREMKERLLKQCPIADRALVSTFHSACAKWLREFAPELGFTSDFAIYDDGDQLSVIKKLIKSSVFPLEQKTSPAEFRQAINHAKILGILPQDREAFKHLFNQFMPLGGVDIYQLYQESLALSNAMDFGDLIMNMLLLLRTNDRVRKIMQHRYKYILVDEYQDTNKPQIELLCLLSNSHHNLFVVGDDDQSIYSWRGAVPSNILDFEKIYPGTKLYKLEKNYRSSSNIVNAAAQLVSNNKERAEKTLQTDNDPGELIDFRYETDADFEAWWVAEQINQEKYRHPFESVAIFYRTNSQSRILEDSLRKRNIPYRIYGSVRFYDRSEVKDILAYLKLMVNNRDDVSFFRALNTPSRGLGDAAEAAIQSVVIEHKLSAFEAAKKIAAEKTPRISSKLENFLSFIELWRNKLNEWSMADFLEQFIEACGYFSYLQKKFPDQWEDKKDNVIELASAIVDFTAANPNAKLSDWLQSVMLDSEVEGEANGVSLMSLHMAKGLEFDRVFLVGLEDGLLPHFNNCDSKLTLEEERRLLYVGITRARKKLSLSAAYMRRTWGDIQTNPVSRFFKEIPPEYVKILTPLGEEKNNADQDQHENNWDIETDKTQYYDFASEDGEFSTNKEFWMSRGAAVFHPTYGLGTVEEIDMNYGKPKAVVKFHDVGLRRVEGKHLSRAPKKT